jgi:hypothetical protein
VALETPTVLSAWIFVIATFSRVDTPNNNITFLFFGALHWIVEARLAVRIPCVDGASIFVVTILYVGSVEIVDGGITVGDTLGVGGVGFVV